MDRSFVTENFTGLFVNKKDLLIEFLIILGIIEIEDTAEIRASTKLESCGIASYQSVRS